MAPATVYAVVGGKEGMHDAIGALIEAAHRATSRFSLLAVHHFHGAASRVLPHETAFALRQDHFMIEFLAAWEPSATDDGSVHRTWADTLSARLAPHALPGGYPNLLANDESERICLAYGSNIRRLHELKQRFDPDGVFSASTGPAFN